MKNIKSKILQRMKTVSFRQGSYSTGMIALVICAVVILNLIVAEIPAAYTKIDVSPNQLFTLGDQTKELVDSLDQEVILYYICESGSEDSLIYELLEQYEGLPNNIKIETKDPVLNPSFATQYTDSEVSNNTVIVVSGDRSRTVLYDEMYEYEVDYTYYSYTTTAFDAEGQITSAIDYVISGELPVIYTLEGHGEAALDTDMQALIEKQNVEFQTLNLLAEEELPEDISCLMILSPTSDLTETEVERITDYMDNGGSVFMTTTYSEEEMPQVDSLLETYGIQKQEGVVVDLNSGNYYQGYPTYLLPDIESHTITETLISDSKYVLLPTAQGIEIAESDDENLSVSSLLQTSDEAISKTDVMNAETYDKEEGDLDGPFSLGVAVTKTVATDESDETDADEADESDETDADETDETDEDAIEGRMVYITSESIMDYSVDEVVSRGNSELVAGAISWLCDEEIVISIPAKSLETEYLTLTSAQTNSWGFILTALIPGLILIGGGIYWFRRRKR